MNFKCRPSNELLSTHLTYITRFHFIISMTDCKMFVPFSFIVILKKTELADVFSVHVVRFLGTISFNT